MALFSPLSVIHCQIMKLGGSNFWRDEYLVLLIEWKGTVPFCRMHWQLLIRCFSDVVTWTWLCQSRFMQGYQFGPWYQIQSWRKRSITPLSTHAPIYQYIHYPQRLCGFPRHFHAYTSKDGVMSIIIHLFSLSYRFDWSYCQSQAPVSIPVNNLLYNHVNYVPIVQSFNIVVHSHPIVMVMVVIVLFDSCNEGKIGYIVWWSTVSYTCHISFNVAICDSSTKAWMVRHDADYPSRDWEPGETDRLVEFMHIIPRCMQQQFFSEPTNHCWYVQSYCSYQSKHLCIGHTKFPTWLQQQESQWRIQQPSSFMV